MGDGFVRSHVEVPGADSRLGSERINPVLPVVIREHGRFLSALAKRLTSGPDADDLLQDAWERAVRLAPARLSPNELRLWIARVMRNLSVDRARGRKAAKRLIYALQCHGDLSTSEALSLPNWRRFDVSDVNAAAARLNAGLRDVLEMSFAISSQAQIAQRLGIREVTVRTRLHRARRQVLAILLAEHAPTVHQSARE